MTANWQLAKLLTTNYSLVTFTKLTNDKQKKYQKGFTIIELVVVLAVFLIIIGVVADVFISMVSSERRILAEQELLNQTSFAIEYMSKAIRMATKDASGNCLGQAGYIYLLTHCDTGNICHGVKFINQTDGNACQEFFLDSTTDPAKPALKEIKGNGTAKNILSDRLEIKYGKFIINGDSTLGFATGGDLIQPRVTVLLDVKTQLTGRQQEKIIQTTVSQRNLNLP